MVYNGAKPISWSMQQANEMLLSKTANNYEACSDTNVKHDTHSIQYRFADMANFEKQ